jgi:aminoglycoside phosphotransferase family enzyme
MTAPAHPAQAAATAQHEQRVAGLVRWLAAADPREPLAVVRTHISTVILAGPLAYKLKRPVRLPFLDFSSLSQRRFFLEEELRINRRTAPQLYLDVLPVTGTVDQPVIGGDGEPADWVLRMRRFEADGEFASMARAGLLQARARGGAGRAPGRLSPLVGAGDRRGAGRPAAQGRAPVGAGEPGRNRRTSLAAEGLLPGRTGSGAARDRRAFTQAQALVDQRRAQGFVRECHGDLHLGNLVRWQGEVFAFDAIEFDARLRCIDIVSDVAFTFMDLHAVGLRPLAWRFINAWAGHTGDYGGLVLLHRYAAYRALVRAKVVLLSGGDAQAFMAPTGAWRKNWCAGRSGRGW